MPALEQNMSDETKDKESPESSTAATLQRFRDVASKMKDAQQRAAEGGAELVKDLSLEERGELMQQVLQRFETKAGDKPATVQAKEMFDAMKRLHSLRSAMNAAEQRMAEGGSQLGKDLTAEQRETLMREMLQRFEAQLIPMMPDEKTRTKAMVVIVVLDICERQILQGLPSDDEWIRLKSILKDRPGALKVVGDLEGAIAKYGEDLRTSVTEGEADEAQMRKAHYGVITQVLMTKLKALSAQTQAQAKTAEPAETKE